MTTYQYQQLETSNQGNTTTSISTWTQHQITCSMAVPAQSGGCGHAWPMPADGILYDSYDYTVLYYTIPYYTMPCYTVTIPYTICHLVYTLIFIDISRARIRSNGRLPGLAGLEGALNPWGQIQHIIMVLILLLLLLLLLIIIIMLLLLLLLLLLKLLLLLLIQIMILIINTKATHNDGPACSPGGGQAGAGGGAWSGLSVHAHCYKCNIACYNYIIIIINITIHISPRGVTSQNGTTNFCTWRLGSCFASCPRCRSLEIGSVIYQAISNKGLR